MDEFTVFLDHDFPFEEAEEIGARLMSLDCLVPGFVAPQVGLLDLGALFYAEQVEGLETVLVVDRNLASRMAQLASEGAPRQWDDPTEVAINLMAFAQTMNLDIDPGLAFRELAHRKGDVEAQGELSWFRAPHRGAARKWIDVAMRRTTTVELGEVAPVEQLELSKPLGRWNRNYIAALKTAHLSLLGGSRLDSIGAARLDDRRLHPRCAGVHVCRAILRPPRCQREDVQISEGAGQGEDDTRYPQCCVGRDIPERVRQAIGASRQHKPPICVRVRGSPIGRTRRRRQRVSTALLKRG